MMISRLLATVSAAALSVMPAAAQQTAPATAAPPGYPSIVLGTPRLGTDGTVYLGFGKTWIPLLNKGGDNALGSIGLPASPVGENDNNAATAAMVQQHLSHVANMAAVAGWADTGFPVEVDGTVTPGDGGRRRMIFDSANLCGAGGHPAADGFVCENSTVPGQTGSWNLDPKETLVPVMFGGNFQALATAAMALNKRAFVPCGTYNNVAPISITVPNSRVFSMRGESQNCVYIDFSQNGLTLTLQGATNNDFSAIDIEDMTLGTLDTTGNSTALLMQANFVNINPAYTATSTVARVTFQDLNNNYWAYGLIDTNVSNANFDEITYTGSSGKGNGILVQGYKPDGANANNDGYAVSVNITNFIGFNAASGIVRGDFVQGLTLANPQCTGCNNGLLIPGPTLAPSNIQVHVRGGQFGLAAGAFGVDCYDSNTGYLDIEGGLYLLGGGATGVKTCGSSPMVVHATFAGDGNANNTAVDIANPGSSADSSRNDAYVAENAINGVGVGVNEEAGITSTVSILNNQFQIPAQGTNYVIGHNDTAMVVDLIPRTVAEVNALVPCTQGTKGSRFVVTDATSPAFMGTAIGGGGTTAQVECDGGSATYVVY